MKIFRLLVILPATMMFLAGCADGVLFQKQYENGRVDRLRIDSAEGWSEYDTTPRYRSQKSRDQDGFGIVMMKEATF